MDERAAEREQRLKTTPVDPERQQEIESVRLAIAQLQQQAASATHPVRREQLSMALKELEQRLEELHQQKS